MRSCQMSGAAGWVCDSCLTMDEDFFGVWRAPLRVLLALLMIGAISAAWVDYNGERADHQRLSQCGSMTQARIVSVVERSRTDTPLVVSVAMPDGVTTDVDVDSVADDLNSGRVAVVSCPGHSQPVLTQHAFVQGPDLASALQVTLLFSALGAVGWFWVFRPPRRSLSRPAPS